MDILFEALAGLFDPLRMAMIMAGVMLGLLVGVIPGIGGIFGLTMLVPITYSLDPVAAFTLLLGMASVTTTSDTIPAVLLGVPGTVGSAATAIDGHELAKQGQAARALGAAYSASLIGGVFGALILALSLPIMKPLVLLFNYGDLLAITIFGLTLVAMLSEGNQLRGVLVALFGVLVSFIGLDPYEGVERWTFGQLYLWEGVPTAIVFLGLFGLSELASLSRRGRIQSAPAAPALSGLLQGMKESLARWVLVLRCSVLGSLLGAIPGVGVTVIEWIAYGDAARRPGDGPPFGEGNIRGVIAPESANNSKEGGSLLPTLAFGIPGSATMAILLGAFAIHGLVPGPEMLESNAPLLVSMILTIAVANILGTVICLTMTPALARMAVIPATILVPLALVFVVLGAFHANKDPRDIIALLVFGLIGITLKRLGWSRPTFALGFVLGPNLERFFFLSYQISGWEWLAQPFVLVMLAIAVAAMLRRLRGWRRGRKSAAPNPFPGPNLVVTLVLLAVFVGSALSGIWMPFAASVFPILVCVPAAAIALILLWLGRRRSDESDILLRKGVPNVRSDALLLGSVGFLGILVLSFGHLYGPFLFVLLAALRLHKASLTTAVAMAGGTSLVSYVIFDLLVPQPWPKPWYLPL